MKKRFFSELFAMKTGISKYKNNYVIPEVHLKNDLAVSTMDRILFIRNEKIEDLLHVEKFFEISLIEKSPDV